MMASRIVAAALAAILVPALAGAQPWPADERIDSIFATWDRDGSPGCALGVMRDGRFVYQRGYGMANLDYAIPNSPRMVYYVGSVSKQFTAAAIARLALAGRLGLDDPVRKYIPELPDYGRPLTVRHLVHHTSGIRDIYVLMNLAGIRMEDVLPDEEALALIARQKELNFLPGDDYLYSNSGYWLLGQIVERVTGESLREYARKNLFEPLGMSRTHFHDDPGHLMTDRVVSYVRADDGAYRIADLPNFDKIGAGGLYTTVEDLLKWDQNFYEPGVGGEAFLEQMHTRGVLNRGDTLSYAFGLTIGMHRGLRTVRHGGSLMGFRAELLRFPEQRLTVAVLCNLGDIAPSRLAERVAAVFLGDRMMPAAPPSPAAEDRDDPRAEAAPSHAVGSLHPYVGEYRSEEVQATYRVVLRGTDLVLERRAAAPAPLVPTSAETFRAGNLELRFRRDVTGVVDAFTVQAGRVQNMRFDRMR
jgi:CubicO group peptidase (beta-lactamase class C family)